MKNCLNLRKIAVLSLLLGAFSALSASDRPAVWFKNRGPHSRITVYGGFYGIVEASWLATDLIEHSEIALAAGMQEYREKAEQRVMSNNDYFPMVNPIEKLEVETDAYLAGLIRFQLARSKADRLVNNDGSVSSSKKP